MLKRKVAAIVKPKVESNEVVNNRINQRLRRLGISGENPAIVSVEEASNIIKNAVKRVRTQAT